MNIKYIEWPQEFWEVGGQKIDPKPLTLKIFGWRHVKQAGEIALP